MAPTKRGLVAQSNHRSCDVTKKSEGMTVTNSNITSYHYIKQKMWPVLGQRSSFIGGYAPASIHPWVKNLKLMSPLDTRLTCCPAPDQQSNHLSSLVQEFTAGASTSIAGQVERACVQMSDEDSLAFQHPQTDWTNNTETATSASEKYVYMNNIVKQCTLFPQDRRTIGSQSQEENNFDGTKSPVLPSRLQEPGKRTLSPYKTDASSQTQNGHNHSMTTSFQIFECNRLKTSSSPNLLADQDSKPARPHVNQSSSSCVTSSDSPAFWPGQVTLTNAPTNFKGRHPYAELSSDSLGIEHHYLDLLQDSWMLESGKPLSPGPGHGSLENPGFDSRPWGLFTSKDISASKDSMIISPENQWGVSTIQEIVPSSSSDDDSTLSLKASAIEDPYSMPFRKMECGPPITGNHGELNGSRDPNQVVWGEKTTGKQLVSSKKRRRKSLSDESKSPEQTVDQLSKTSSKERTGDSRGLASHAQSVAGFSGQVHGLADQMDKACNPWEQKYRRGYFLHEKQIASSSEPGKSAQPGDHFWKTQTEPHEKVHVISNKTTNTGRVVKVALKRTTCSNENKIKESKHTKSYQENIMGEKSEEFSSSRHGTVKKDASLKSGKHGRRPNKDKGLLSMDIKNAPCVTHEEFTYGKCSNLDLFQPTSKRHKRCYILRSPAITTEQFGLVRSNPASRSSCRAVLSRRTSLSSLPLSVPPKLTSLSQSRIPSIACNRNNMNLMNEKLVCAKLNTAPAKPQRMSTSHTIIWDKGSITLQANCSSGSPARQREKTSRAACRRKTSLLSPSKSAVTPRSSVRPNSFSARPQKPMTDLSVCTFKPSAISTAATSDRSTKSTAKVSSSGRIQDVVAKDIKGKRTLSESSSGADQHDIRTITSCLRQPACTPIPQERSVVNHGLDINPNSNIRHVYFDLPQALRRKWKISDKTAVENPNPSKTKDGDKGRVSNHCKASFRTEGRDKKKKADYCNLGVQTDDVCSSVPSPSAQPITTTTASADATMSDTNSQTRAGDCLKSEHAQVFNDIQLTSDPNLKIQAKAKKDGGHFLRGFFASSQASDLCNSTSYCNESQRERAKVRSRSEDPSVTSTISKASDEKIPSSECSRNQSLASLGMVTLGNGLYRITKLFTFH